MTKQSRALLPHDPPARAADPLSALRAEHALLQDAAAEVEWLLSRRTLLEDEHLALDATMRALRTMLPDHLVKEEFRLFPEIREAEPAAADGLRELKERHLVVEEDFANLQALVLAFDVQSLPEGARRRARKVAELLRADLASLIALEEQKAFSVAQRALTPEAFERVSAAFEAIEQKESMKRSRMR